MKGWQELWQNPRVRERWEAIPPLPEVVEMADRLEHDREKRVLDISCGLGRHTIYLAARGFEVTATDVASSAIEKSTNNLENAGLRAMVIEVEMTQFPWSDGHFNAVVASNVIHHTDLTTLKGIIGSITRVLAPGGYFVWVTPTPRHYTCGRGRELEPMTWVDSDDMDGHLPHHYSTEQEVRELLLDYDMLSMYEHEYREGENSRYHWRILARKRPE